MRSMLRMLVGRCLWIPTPTRPVAASTSSSSSRTRAPTTATPTSIRTPSITNISSSSSSTPLLISSTMSRRVCTPIKRMPPSSSTTRTEPMTPHNSHRGGTTPHSTSSIRRTTALPLTQTARPVRHTTSSSSGVVGISSRRTPHRRQRTMASKACQRNLSTTTNSSRISRPHLHPLPPSQRRPSTSTRSPRVTRGVSARSSTR
mmetsp:Transcript_47697/g.119300  ORF Transcript_47697/g.119300 Transcript_47697/m.119300 type:complete len:203 (-) Transcript_47697:1880-2488(-)